MYDTYVELAVSRHDYALLLIVPQSRFGDKTLSI